MLKLETWIALGSLGMAVMFAALMISFYLFLVGPDGKGPRIYVDPQGVLIQIISISGVPSLVLAGTVFGLQKTNTVKEAAVILITVGILLVVSMAIVIMIVPKISSSYTFASLHVVPFVFIASGIGVAGLAGYLQYRSRIFRQNFEDEKY